MNSLNFFPTLTDDLFNEVGINLCGYNFAYLEHGYPVCLNAKGTSTIQLEDPLDTWKVEADGLRVSRDLTIEYPDLLKGENGLVCEDAEFGVCIIWTNRSLSQMGYILPDSEGGRSGLKFHFSHDFPPGELKGDLHLETVIYVKEAADTVRTGEECLINKAGVTVGVIDELRVNSSSSDMDFPIMEVEDIKAPLWWLDLNQWEDPTQDPFNEEYVCLYLNTAHSSCPLAGGNARDLDMLVEIVSTAYLMMFQEIIARECLEKTLNDVDLAPGSIAKILFYFSDGCDPQLRTETINALQKSISINVERMLKGGEASDN